MAEIKTCHGCKYLEDMRCSNKSGHYFRGFQCSEYATQNSKEIIAEQLSEIAENLYREAETVPVVTEQAEPDQNAAYWMNKALESAHEAWENLHDTADFKKAIEQAEAIKEHLGIAEHDAVNHPSHYTAGGIECIEALKAATTRLTGIEAVCTANAIKYLWRWKDKNGAEDIRKAIWYCERLLKEIGDERTE